jgi:hypothetical protein
MKCWEDHIAARIVHLRAYLFTAKIFGLQVAHPESLEAAMRFENRLHVENDPFQIFLE